MLDPKQGGTHLFSGRLPVPRELLLSQLRG
jgi:hypothetical protein